MVLRYAAGLGGLAESERHSSRRWGEGEDGERICEHDEMKSNSYRDSFKNQLQTYLILFCLGGGQGVNRTKHHKTPAWSRPSWWFLLEASRFGGHRCSVTFVSLWLQAATRRTGTPSPRAAWAGVG